MIALIVLMLAIVYSIYFIIREKLKRKSNIKKYDRDLHRVFIGILLFSLVMSSLFAFGIIQTANFLKESRDVEALDIKVVRDWYKKTASAIDQELTLNEYEYMEYEFAPIRPIGKSKMYFNAIGFEPVGKLWIEGITKQGKIERFTAYIDILEDSSIEKSRVLKLKYTSEFGTDYDLGEGVYYGHLYISEFDLLKLNTKMNRR